MNTELILLCFTAATIGLIHTLIGPDHYLPFIVMARARKWSIAKTATITLLCGVGHIMSSVILGVIGIAFGIGIMRLEVFESFRGNIAAWALIGFGAAYFVWGVHRAIRNRPHKHSHFHEGVLSHTHDHTHIGDHAHVHEANKKNVTPWILFTIFVLGPCEPLIPILMYPAAKNSISGLILVTGIFGITTLTVMVGAVLAATWGMSFAYLGRLERFTHAIAGGTICASGIAIQFLGM